MSGDFLHVRIDPIKKREAERILNGLGMNLTTGINLCINSIIRAKGLPFDLKLSREEALGTKAYKMETAFQSVVAEAIASDRAYGHPIALYDKERNCPYLEYPDGRREYDEA